MKILALERESPAAAPGDFAAHLADEAARAWQLYQSGLIRELYFDASQHTAVLVLEAASLAEAEAALDSLPLVQLGLIHFELVELAPYDGFARLFARD